METTFHLKATLAQAGVVLFRLHLDTEILSVQISTDNAKTWTRVQAITLDHFAAATVRRVLERLGPAPRNVQ